eukprot:GHVU01159904.1.p1 GENE.GHVU01159904.1~~GHVU01159904.1.p1  ORF type:complete len:108 (-),score=21.35 GHVU01159904.1:621-944(-)
MSGRVGPCLTVPLCPLFCRPQAELMREMDTQLRALQLHEAEDDDKGINSDETVPGSRRSLGDPSKGVVSNAATTVGAVDDEAVGRALLRSVAEQPPLQEGPGSLLMR